MCVYLGAIRNNFNANRCVYPLALPIKTRASEKITEKKRCYKISNVNNSIVSNGCFYERLNQIKNQI